MNVFLCPLILLLLLTLPGSAGAQPQVPAPSQPILTLGELLRAVTTADPRRKQLELLERQSNLRQQNLDTSRLPSLSIDALAQFQSDVPTSPLRLPNGDPAFTAPRATTDASTRLDLRLFDPLRGPQVALERAQLDEQRARVNTALFTLKQRAREWYFAAHTIRERMVVLSTSLATLAANRQAAEARLMAGTAVPADVAEVDAAILDLRQENEALSSQLQGVLQGLETLAGRPVSLTAPFEVPQNLDATIVQALSGTSQRLRPEFAQFDGARLRLSRQSEMADASQRPRVSAFGRVGYGRPGLNFIGNRFDLYGIVGLQLQWRPIDWGVAAREREALQLGQQIVDADEQAFAQSLNARMPGYFLPLFRLQAALADDDRIIALREQVERTASTRQQAGVITMTEYLATNAELTQARNARAARRVELARMTTEMLETAGVEIP